MISVEYMYVHTSKYIYFSSHFLSLPFGSLSLLVVLFSLLPSRISDPGSHSRLFFPPAPYGSGLAFFIARRFQLFLPSSTRVELCLPTLQLPEQRGIYDTIHFFNTCWSCHVPGNNIPGTEYQVMLTIITALSYAGSVHHVV